MSPNNHSNNQKFPWVGLTSAAIATMAGAVAYYYMYSEQEGNPLTSFLNYLKGDEQPDSEAKDVARDGVGLNSEVMSEDDVIEMLKKISSIQQDTKIFLKDLVEKTAAHPKTLSEIYAQVKDGTPDDPLAAEGISIDDFDGLLGKYENRKDVKDLIDLIMGNEVLDDVPSNARALTVEEIIDIHKYMYNQLRSVVDEAKKLANDRGNFQSRYLTMAGQALVGARVFKKYGMHPQEIEAAMMLNYMTLQYEHEFLKVSVQIQATLGELMAVHE